MKIAAPRSADEYFRKTEHAVRHLYEGLDSCWSYYRSASEHWDVTKIGKPMTPEENAALNKYLELAGQVFIGGRPLEPGLDPPPAIACMTDTAYFGDRDRSDRGIVITQIGTS